MSACDHLVWFKEVDDGEVGKKHYPCTVSDLTEGIFARIDAEETAKLAPDPDEHVFTFCPNCGARIDWDAIRGWAKACIATAEANEVTKAQEEEERRFAELRRVREASFGGEGGP